MTKFLIAFPAAAMVVPAEEMAAVDCDAHAVIAQTKAEGVYVFAARIDGGLPPVRVSADGTVTQGGYPAARPLDGGFAVLERPSHEAALSWAARFARACRCDQEVRAFGFDPQS